jgi:hypothetical protein
VFAIALALAASLIGGRSAPAHAEALDQAESDLVAEVNAFRAGRGLGTLAVSETLSAAAKWMSTSMATNNYISHTSVDGRSATQRMADAGYPTKGTWTGENIAAGYSTAAQVVRAWIASPPHLGNLSNPNFRAIGVGRAYGAGSALSWYWTANFGGVVDRVAAAAAAAAEPVVAEPVGATPTRITVVARQPTPVAAPIRVSQPLLQTRSGARQAAAAADSQDAQAARVLEELTALASGLRSGYRSWCRCDWLDVRDVIRGTWLDEAIATMVEVR